MNAAASAAIRADAFCFLQVPDALLVQEILAAEGADRTEIDDVAGQLVLQRVTGEDVDLGPVAAIDDLQFGRARNLARETNAARAHDAAIGEQGDGGTD